MPFTRFLPVLTLPLALAAFAPGGAIAQQAGNSPSPSAPPSAAPLPSPVPTTEPANLHKLAVQQFLAWQQGQINHTLYSDSINGELTDDVVTAASRTLANLGALQSATFRGVSHAPQGDLYVYHMICDRGAVDMDFGLDPKGLIQSIFFN